MPDGNPYASPAEFDDRHPTAAPNSAEAVRGEHLKHESAVRAAGWLFLLPAAPLLLLAIGGLASVANQAATAPTSPGVNLLEAAGATLLYGGFGLSFMWVGLGLRQLAPRVRKWAIALCAIGLLRFPFGTIVNGYLIWLLAGARTDFLFSLEYQAVIAATPYLRPKSPKLLWLWLWLTLLVADIVGIVSLMLWSIPV